jgi:hypothetical protein
VQILIKVTKNSKNFFKIGEASNMGGASIIGRGLRRYSLRIFIFKNDGFHREVAQLGEDGKITIFLLSKV